ncbi:MAG: glutamine transport system substrate-binding protein [Thermoplasmata archaeon]|jgi:ABC-type amino acid transport substrate-binding protein|nr:glutamine transport system substrate-binding protein [Thermoplasmata archaeon]
MSRAPILLASLLLLAPLLAGCATNNGSPAASSTPASSTVASSTPASSTPVSSTPASGLGTVKVGTEADYPPFEDTTSDGKIVGFDIDVMKEVANRSGFQVSFQNAQFQAIIPSIQSGQFDMGASAFTITDERKQQVDFSVPYYDNDLQVAVRADEGSITKESDLPAHKVCTQTGTTSETWLLDHHQPNASIVRFDAFPPCADALKRGDVDAMMIDQATVRDLVQKSNGALKNAFLITTGEQFGFPVKKGSAALLTAINAALVAMKQDGTLDRMAQQWSV